MVCVVSCGSTGDGASPAEAGLPVAALSSPKTVTQLPTPTNTPSPPTPIPTKPVEPSSPVPSPAPSPAGNQPLPPVNPNAGPQPQGPPPAGNQPPANSNAPVPLDPNAPPPPPGNVENEPVGPAACTSLGLLFRPPAYGVELGQPIADPGVTMLADGRVRLYMFAQGVGIVSATSDDGIAFTEDAGVRVPEGIGGQSKPFRLPDGRLRLYSTKIDGITSFISDDDLNFVQETGYRLTAAAAGLETISNPSVIEFAPGQYRMYYSTIAFPGEKPGGRSVGSAVSTDLLNWSVDPGFRLGPDAPVLTDSAEHPSAVRASDGSVYLFYGKFPGPGTIYREQNVKCSGPIFPGDELVARLEVIKIDEDEGQATLKHIVKNGTMLALDGTAKVFLAKVFVRPSRTRTEQPKQKQGA